MGAFTASTPFSGVRRYGPCSWLIGAFDLGIQGPLRRFRSAAAPTFAAEHERHADRDDRPDQRPRDVDPVVGEVGTDEVGAERAGRVHGRTRDRTAPQACQGDVPADRQRADRTDVLGARCGTEDDAQQTQGENRFHQESVGCGVSGGHIVGAKGRGDVDDGLEEPGGEGRSDELDDDVAGHAAPREISSKREPHTHRGIEMRAGDLAHEQDDSNHHQPRCDHGRRATDRVRERVTHHRAAGGDKHQEERPQQLGEKAPSFKFPIGIIEIITSSSHNLLYLEKHCI